jgi:hypothetical protein
MSNKKEKPIIFSTPMVRAIINGQKTMTRRPVSRIARFGNVTEFGESNTPGYKWQFRDKRMRWNDVRDIIPPYQKGDILWVRETHWVNGEWFSYISENGKYGREFVEFTDDNAQVLFDDPEDETISYMKRPSIFMPRKAARLFLEVKNVRVERLQCISEKDAEAEGCGLEALKEWAKNNCPELEYPYWLGLNNRPEPYSELWKEIDSSLSYCRKCAEKEAARLNKKYPNTVFVDGGWSQDEDRVINCEICYKPLDFSATEECLKSEYEHWVKHGIEKPDGYVLEQIIGMEDSLPEEYPKLRSILFRRLWDDLYAKRGYGWDSNPWVWVIEFERMPQAV